MNSDQLRALIERLDMTQSAFADLIGVGHRTVRHYVDTGVTNMPTMILIKLLAQRKISIADIEKARRAL